MLSSSFPSNFEEFSGWWSCFSEEFGCTFLSKFLFADAHRERGLDGGRYEEFPKYFQILGLYLENER